MQFAIDFAKPYSQYEQDIDRMLADCKTNNLAITIAYRLVHNTDMLWMASAILSHIDCTKCDGRCCREVKHGYVVVTPEDYKRLQKIDGAKHVIIRGNEPVLPQPCPYLTNGRCASHIYLNRPATCSQYPLQAATGGYIALQRDCPQAEIAARKIYLTFWHLMNAGRSDAHA